MGEPLKSLGKSIVEEEKETSKAMIEFWSNFAKFDDPNGEESQEGGWPESVKPKFKYLEVGMSREKPTVRNNMRDRVCKFWDEILPLFVAPGVNRAEESALVSHNVTGENKSCSRLGVEGRMYFPR